MKSNENINKIGPIIGLGLIVLMTVILGVNRPFFELLSVLLLTVYISIITVIFRETIGTLVCLILFALLLILFPFLTALIKTICISIVGITIGYGIRNNFSLNANLVISATSYIVCFTIINLVVLKLLGLNIIQDVFVNSPLRLFEGNKQEIISFIKPYIASPGDFYSNIMQELHTFFLIIPSIITVSALILGGITLCTAVIILSKMGRETTSIEPFSEFRLPMGMGMAFVICQLATWNSDLINSTVSKSTMLFLNIFWIITFGFFMQGISLLDYWIKKYAVSGYLRIPLYIIGAVILIPFMLFINILFVLAGILDYIVDFRKLEAR